VALGDELLVAVEEIRTGALVEDVLVAVDTLARLGDFIELELPFPTGLLTRLGKWLKSGLIDRPP
jgi:adenylate cyclase class IV